MGSQKQHKGLLVVGGALALLFLSSFSKAKFIVSNYADVARAAADTIINFEGFRANPYWDVSRYSWGYGTPAPGRYGTITRDQAFIELESFNVANFNYLFDLVTRPLTVNQWAALLSFAYNLGPGNADNLIQNINSGNDTALGEQWNSYINSGGAPNPALIERRAAEFAQWLS